MSDFEKISVRNVKQHEQQFSATVTVEDLILEETKTYEVRTNERGNGFWIDGQQKAGTSQFSASNKDQWRRKVRYWFTY